MPARMFISVEKAHKQVASKNILEGVGMSKNILNDVININKVS